MRILSFSVIILLFVINHPLNSATAINDQPRVVLEEMTKQLSKKEIRKKKRQLRKGLRKKSDNSKMIRVLTIPFLIMIGIGITFLIASTEELAFIVNGIYLLLAILGLIPFVKETVQKGKSFIIEKGKAFGWLYLFFTLVMTFGVFLLLFLAPPGGYGGFELNEIFVKIGALVTFILGLIPSVYLLLKRD